MAKLLHVECNPKRMIRSAYTSGDFVVLEINDGCDHYRESLAAVVDGFRKAADEIEMALHLFPPKP